MAVTREDPPRLIIAADEEVLSRAIATTVIAQEDPSSLEKDNLDSLRSALLEERWTDAVGIWMETASASVDVYPDEEVITQDDLTREAAAFSIRLSRLFTNRESEN